MTQTYLKYALSKIKVVFQQPKFEVVFQIRVSLRKEVETRDTVISSSTICATETSPIYPNYSSGNFCDEFLNHRDLVWGKTPEVVTEEFICLYVVYFK